MKICTKCKIEKEINEFRSKIGPKASKNGLNPQCRICERDAKREYDAKKKQENPFKFCYICKLTKHCDVFFKYSKTGDKCLECVEEEKKKQIEYSKQFRVQHLDETKRCSKCLIFVPFEQFWKSKHTIDGFYSSCIQCTKLSSSKFSERKLKNQRDWRKNNLQKARSLINNWDKRKRQTDPSYKLRRNVMHAIVASIRNYGFKNEQTIALNKAIFAYLPYTANQLKTHIEALWEDWMNWDNYGRFHPEHETWQIDHIIPQSKLIFSNLEDENFQTLWALRNLRPLETIANIKKSNTLLIDISNMHKSVS